MTDRPNLGELLDAVRLHIETAVLPVVRLDPRLYFQTLVALNMLRIAQRELASGPEMRRTEWDWLNRLTGEARDAPERDADLAEALGVRYHALRHAIRRGEYDSSDGGRRLAEFLEPVVAAQLIVNNPGLAQRLGEELRLDSFAE